MGEAAVGDGMHGDNLAMTLEKHTGDLNGSQST